MARRAIAYKLVGVDLLLLGFLHIREEVEAFGQRVIPLVRDLAAPLAAGADVDLGDEIELALAILESQAVKA